MICVRTVAASLGLAACATAGGDPRSTERGADLAVAAGCNTCHADRAAPAGSPPPVAPAWSEIAARYRARPDAAEALVPVVIGGSDERHWKGSPFVSMLPNERALCAEEARQVVRWILAQPPH